MKFPNDENLHTAKIPSTVEKSASRRQSSVHSSMKAALLNANGISSHERECIRFFEKHHLDLMLIQDSRISLSRTFNYSCLNTSAVSGHLIRRQDPYFSQILLHRKHLRLNVLPCRKPECVIVEIEPQNTNDPPTIIVSLVGHLGPD